MIKRLDTGELYEHTMRIAWRLLSSLGWVMALLVVAFR